MKRELRDDGGPNRRFVNYEAQPEKVSSLQPDHPAVVEGRTLFPGNVKATKDSVRFLISGVNNAKIGKVVTKGPWTGFPIFTLTLTERATCPRSCHVWEACYGNSLQWPSRWDHTDPDFIDFLRAEIITTCRLNPKGLVVRLHILGDFYSMSYVKMWVEMVDRFPQLHVYGYTARTEDADDPESREMAKALRWLTDTAPDQFCMRFSRSEAGAGHTIVVDEDPHQDAVLMCPAQVHKTETCASCGLCWAPAARAKTIGFLRHGIKHPSGPRTEKTPRKPRQLNTSQSLRPVKGGLLGETRVDRDVRVKLYVASHPAMTYAQISRELDVPLPVVSAMGRQLDQKRARGKRSTYLPPQQFTPSASPFSTSEERLAAISDDDKAAIAARYGVKFR